MNSYHFKLTIPEREIFWRQCEIFLNKHPNVTSPPQSIDLTTVQNQDQDTDDASTIYNLNSQAIDISDNNFESILDSYALQPEQLFEDVPQDFYDVLNASQKPLIDYVQQEQQQQQQHLKEYIVYPNNYMQQQQFKESNHYEYIGNHTQHRFDYFESQQQQFPEYIMYPNNYMQEQQKQQLFKKSKVYQNYNNYGHEMNFMQQQQQQRLPIYHEHNGYHERLMNYMQQQQQQHLRKEIFYPSDSNHNQNMMNYGDNTQFSTFLNIHTPPPTPLASYIIPETAKNQHKKIKSTNIPALDKHLNNNRDNKENSTATATAMATCNICEKTFTSASYLTQHRRAIHSGINLPCYNCPKILHSAEALKKHMKGHAVAKKKCPHCARQYFHTWDLTRHIITHHDQEQEKLKCCKYCSKKFVRKDQLQRHINRKHAKLCGDMIT